MTSALLCVLLLVWRAAAVGPVVNPNDLMLNSEEMIIEREGFEAMAAAILKRAEANANLRHALANPSFSVHLLRDLATAEFRRGRTAVSKQIFHQAVVFIALAVMDPSELLKLEEYGCTQNNFLRDLATIGNSARLLQSDLQWPNLPEPSTAYDPASISIVSLCEYDPLKSPLTVLSASNKYRYARKHGYQLYFETKRLDPSRPPAWSKIGIVKKYLPKSAWVVWVDCDSFFMDDSKALTDLLPHPTRDPNVDFVISEDGLTVNTGVFMIKNTVWAAEMLDVWYGNFDSPFVYHPHWEQAAFISMMTYSRWVVGYGVPPIECCELGMDPFGNCAGYGSAEDLARAARVLSTLHSRVLFHPQKWMNSYPPALSNFIRDWEERPAHAKYTRGDFILSFSGCGFILGANTCNALYDEYYDESERLNAGIGAQK